MPLEATLRHAAEANWGGFVHTIVEVETDEVIVGLGKVKGDEELAEYI